MSNDAAERFYIEMESARKQAEKEYFEARPQLEHTIANGCIYRAGFERAFRLLWPATQTSGKSDA